MPEFCQKGQNSGILKNTSKRLCAWISRGDMRGENYSEGLFAYKICI